MAIPESGEGVGGSPAVCMPMKHVIVDYWKLFPLSWKYSARPSASGNIANFGEIITNSHLNVSNCIIMHNLQK